MRMSKETKVIPDALKELKKSIALALTKHYPVNNKRVQQVHFFEALSHTHTRDI